MNIKHRLSTLVTLVLASLGFAGDRAAAQDVEEAQWNYARSVNSPEAYQQYLDQFPDGRHAADAFAGIVLFARNIRANGLGPIEPAAGEASVRAAPLLY